MGVTSQQGFKFKLVADGVILDLFKDEEILLSDNVTGLFDLGILPSDFTRQITLPGSKKNNHFFEFVYDISVENPYTFSTNQKVQCYLDFDGIYLSNGYLQLNKVNVYQNKFIDSYEVTIYGGLASFGRDLKRTFLTDLTGSLSQFNHTASFENISSSWGGNLFSGSIVYPMCEYGQKIQYNPAANQYGIDDEFGALCVQDFKPAIRIKEVWDACFETFGYTYTSSFWNEAWLDNVYMVCNNQLRYPVFNSASNGANAVDIETYGLFKIGSAAGVSNNVTLPQNTTLPLPWYNILYNPSNSINANLEYDLGIETRLRGELNLSFQLSGSQSQSCAPQFYLVIQKNTGTWNDYVSMSLDNINSYMSDIKNYNATRTATQTFELFTQWNQVRNGSIWALDPGQYRFGLKQVPIGANTNYTITLDPGDTLKSYLSVTKVNQAGDGLIMDIPSNMPYGTTGIKLIDFISSIQKKFNLVIYPNKTKLNEFIVEPFNSWYKRGQIKDFNKYINLNAKISVTPANNLAVNQLNFGDTLDQDYVSQQFAKGANREFGKQYYIDTENFFSQGTFEVKTGLASSPLVYIANTGLSGSQTISQVGFQATAEAISTANNVAQSYSKIYLGANQIVAADALAFAFTSQVTSDPNVGYTTANVQVDDVITFEADTPEANISLWQFKKIKDGVETIIGTQMNGSLQTYNVTAADLTATTLYFTANAYAETNI